MTKLLPEYKRSTVYALIGMAFHFVVVVVPLLLSGGTGKLAYAHGHLLLFLDFPLFFPLITTPPSELKFIIDSMGTTLYFSLCGTILYALGGWLIGYARDKYSQRRQKK